MSGLGVRILSLWFYGSSDTDNPFPQKVLEHRVKEYQVLGRDIVFLNPTMAINTSEIAQPGVSFTIRHRGREGVLALAVRFGYLGYFEVLYREHGTEWVFV